MAPKRRRVEAMVDLTGDDGNEQGNATTGQPAPSNVRTPAKPRAKRARTARVAVEDDEDALEEAPAAVPRGRRPKKAAEPEEKRVDEHGVTVKFRPQPGQDTIDRIERALGQRMFLISSTQVRAVGDSEGAQQEFAVLGSTGNGK